MRQYTLLFCLFFLFGGCASTPTLDFARTAPVPPHALKSKKGSKVPLKELERLLTRRAQLGVLKLELRADVLLVTKPFLKAKHLKEGKQYGYDKYGIINRYKEDLKKMIRRATCFRIKLTTHVGEMDSVKLGNFFILAKQAGAEKYRRANFDSVDLKRIPEGKVVGGGVSSEKNEWSNVGFACTKRPLKPQKGIEVVIVPKARRESKLQVGWNIPEDRLTPLS